MPVPRGLATPRRILALVPLVTVAGAILFGLVSGIAYTVEPHGDASAAQRVATAPVAPAPKT